MSSKGNHAQLLASSMAADLVRIQLPMFFVTTLCFAQDYVLTVGLGLPRSLGRFLIWNAFYTFGFQYALRRRCRSLPEALYVFAVNTFLYKATEVSRVLLASSWLLWLYPALFGALIIVTEFIHFSLFDRDLSKAPVHRANTFKETLQGKHSRGAENDYQHGRGVPTTTASNDNGSSGEEEQYVVKWNGKPSEYLLSLITSAFIMLGAFRFKEMEDTTYTISLQMLLFVPLNIVSDMLFGVPHNLSHRLPALWRRHKIHHEYRRNELCAFANFYSEFFDGLLMMYPLLFVTGLSYRWDMPVWSIMDNAVLAGFTHHKYVHQYLAYFSAYEVDMLIDVLLGSKITAFHNGHHQDQTERFSVFGLVSDGTLRLMADLLVAKAAIPNVPDTCIDTDNTNDFKTATISPESHPRSPRNSARK